MSPVEPDDQDPTDERMPPFRPSAPFGNPAWTRLDGERFFAEVGPTGERMRPELFRMIQRFRRARIRLIVEAVLLVIATVVFLLVPNLGEIIVVTVIAIPTLYDLLLVLHLRARIQEAWEDLSLGPEA